jgi:hypothetical protein
MCVHSSRCHTVSLVCDGGVYMITIYTVCSEGMCSGDTGVLSAYDASG